MASVAPTPSAAPDAGTPSPVAPGAAQPAPGQTQPDSGQDAAAQAAEAAQLEAIFGPDVETREHGIEGLRARRGPIKPIPPRQRERGASLRIDGTPIPDALDDADATVQPDDGESLGVLEVGKGENRKQYQIPKPVEGYVKTLQGQFKAFHTRATQGVESAKAWQAHANKIAAELANLRHAVAQGRTVPPTAPENGSRQPTAGAQPSGATGQTPTTLLKAVDWKAFDSAYKQNPATAIGYLLTEIEEHSAAQLSALEARIKSQMFDPLHESASSAREVHQTAGLMDELADAKDSSGAELFPELNSSNPQLLSAILKTWQDLPGDLPKTKKGFYLAMLQIRDYARRNNMVLPGAAAAASTRQSTQPEPVSSHEQTRAADSVLSGQGGGVPSTAVDARRMSPAEALLAELDSAGRSGGDVYSSMGLRAPRR